MDNEYERAVVPPLPAPPPTARTSAHWADETMDIMNDDARDHMETDADTCRICRGEATLNEPLFYPCKCSGSIKFVHQDCLMEWLSHSQKKHCELCKTAFRFTKLYSPTMPDTLPNLVFARHLLSYTWQNFTTWLRFCLVVFVWLALLPWAMRHVWTFLFWLGDGAWFVSSPGPTKITNKGVKIPFSQLQAYLDASCSLPVPTAYPTTGVHEVNALNHLFAEARKGWEVKATSVSIFGLLKSVVIRAVTIWFNPLSLLSTTMPTSAQPSTKPAAVLRTACDQTTLLGDVQFLKTLTRSAWLNRNLITILEGQIITIIVVVCFVLVFLIREWVVQQHPAINMGAGFNAQIQRIPVVPVVPAAPQPAEDAESRSLATNIHRQGDQTQSEDDSWRLLMPERIREHVISFGIDGVPEDMTSRLLEKWEMTMTASPGATAREIASTLQGLMLETRYRDRVLEVDYLIEDDDVETLIANVIPILVCCVMDQETVLVQSEVEEGRQEGQGQNSDLRGEAAQINWDDAYNENGVSPASSSDRLSIESQSRNIKGIATEISQTLRQRDERFDILRAQRFSSWLYDVPKEDLLKDDGTKPESTTPSLANFGLLAAYGYDEDDLSMLVTDLRCPETSTDRSVRTALAAERDSGDNRESLPEDWEDELTREDGQMPTEPEIGSPSLLVPVSLPATGQSDAQPVLPQTPPQGMLGHVAEWLWRDIIVPNELPVEDDERLVDDEAQEEPFVPVNRQVNNEPFNGQIGQRIAELNQQQDARQQRFEQGRIALERLRDNRDVQQQDIEVLEVRRANGVDLDDQDVMDDIEDFEGIMELVGMRGPMLGLVQNALFSAVLISLTLACGVWVPYNVGRFSLLLIADPISTAKLPLRILFSFVEFLQDLTLAIVGTATYLLLGFLQLSKYANTGRSIFGNLDPTAIMCLQLARAALNRIANGLLGAVVSLPNSEILEFSALSHEALIYIKGLTIAILTTLGSTVTSILLPPPGGFVQQTTMNISPITDLFGTYGTIFLQFVRSIPQLLTKSDYWVISLDAPIRATPVDPLLSCWTGMDRFWAVLAGYMSFCFIGGAYLRRGSPFSSGETGREWESTVIDLLNQAGGVIKVILIISIEMLLFPLYCGLLLDFALLPLFDNASISSRLMFTIYTPLTSVFVHWFVGTCYMFHFALFVSMCRKIMRPGVLYFIRDPDDPTFHPVRDVLERNIATQLRKITFSAMVYGALVIICLGGVVWSLALAFPGVLPIRWSSNEPVLEFPVDLLFYNFFMPIAIKFLQPADSLHVMYTWWFRRCARMLRLTWFLFDERRSDEEGAHAHDSWWAALRSIWAEDTAARDSDAPIEFINRALRSKENENEGFEYNVMTFEQPSSASFARDGQYVRAPASDQVRLPKAHPVFHPVTAQNTELTGHPEPPQDDPHGRNNKLFKLVYIPSHFPARITTFIVLIWLFAAFTGVGITIVPLVLGRRLFTYLLPEHVQKNDVYAFAIGVYVLGSALWLALHLQSLVVTALHRARSTELRAQVARITQNGVKLTSRVVRLAYAYTAFAIVLPLLFALVVELYVITPLHTYMHNDALHPAEHAPTILGRGSSFFENHTIHLVQSWTLGLLYLKLTSRLILAHLPQTRLAEAIRRITRAPHSYANPDISVATRCVMLPAVFVLLTLLCIPLGGAWTLVAFCEGKVAGSGQEIVKQEAGSTLTINGLDSIQRMLVFRYAYPMAMAAAVNAWAVMRVARLVAGWRSRIRDEVYLIGERLHNFGEISRSGGGRGLGKGVDAGVRGGVGAVRGRVEGVGI